MTIAVETKELSKTYRIGGLTGTRTVQALDRLTLEIPEGQVFGLVGPNGAGKSTTIKLLLNLIRPTSGQCRLFGRDPSEADARRAVGFLPENPSPYEYLTGREFVTLAGRLAQVPRAQLKARVETVLEQVQMAPFGDMQIRRYSKGMTQRIALAQALVHEPRLLILDEPTSGLDVLGRQLIRDLIVSEHKRGTTVLLCSHIIPDVEALSQQVAIVIGGRLVKSGPVSQMLSASTQQVEIVVDHASAELAVELEKLGKVNLAGNRLTAVVEPSAVKPALERALGAGGAIVSVQPTRYSLEETFIEAIKQSGASVGGALS